MSAGKADPANANYLLLSCLYACLISGMAGCATESGEGPVHHEFLEPLTEITGAPAGMFPQTSLRQSNPPMVPDFITLQRPAAMSARGNDIYFIDAGLHRIFHYDTMQQTLAPFAASLPVNTGMNLLVAPDRTVYVTDPSHSQVLHFNWDGTQLPALASPGNLGHPVSVLVNEHNGRVLVADRLFNQIVVFENFGMMESIVKPQHVRSIAAMASGPDGIYIVDSLSRRIDVLWPNGTFRYSLGENLFNEPGLIAVSRSNFIFASDNFDHTIRVFHRTGNSDAIPKLVDEIGGSGVPAGEFGPDTFNEISGMAISEGLLYVSDGISGKIMVMTINPAALNKKGIK